jgi:hypothetical protein
LDAFVIREQRLPDFVMPVHCVDVALCTSEEFSPRSNNSFVTVVGGLQTEQAEYALLFASANVVSILL